MQKIRDEKEQEEQNRRVRESEVAEQAAADAEGGEENFVGEEGEARVEL